MTKVYIEIERISTFENYTFPLDDFSVQRYLDTSQPVKDIRRWLNENVDTNLYDLMYNSYLSYADCMQIYSICVDFDNQEHAIWFTMKFK